MNKEEEVLIDKFAKACVDLECGECSQNVSTITNYNCKLEFLDAKPNMYESVNKERLVEFLKDKELPRKKVKSDEETDKIITESNEDKEEKIFGKVAEYLKEEKHWEARDTPIAEIVQKEKGTKHDQDKMRWSLLPLAPLKKVIKVLEFGANKYSVDNWKSVSKERYKDALWRHWIAYCEDENSVDEESGECHLAHLLCCGLFLLWFKIKGK